MLQGSYDYPSREQAPRPQGSRMDPAGALRQPRCGQIGRIRGGQQAYGPAEQRKLTCRALGVSDKVFAAYSEAEQEELIGLELWVAEK